MQWGALEHKPPIPAFPRGRGKETSETHPHCLLFAPSPACGGGLGWGPGFPRHPSQPTHPHPDLPPRAGEGDKRNASAPPAFRSLPRLRGRVGVGARLSAPPIPLFHFIPPPCRKGPDSPGYNPAPARGGRSGPCPTGTDPLPKAQTPVIAQAPDRHVPQHSGETGCRDRHAPAPKGHEAQGQVNTSPPRFQTLRQKDRGAPRMQPACSFRTPDR